MKRLENKVALISGTAQGQGRAAALRFASEGALVVGGDIKSDLAAQTDSLVQGQGGSCNSPAELDVTNEASVKAWIDFAIKLHGRIDVLYANAGAVKFEALDTQSLADWNFTVAAELSSVFLSVKAAWPYLKQSKGNVITVGSTAGISGSITNKRIAHTATKGGVVVMTKQIAAEGAEFGIRANCISPGMIDTEGATSSFAALPEDHPMKRISQSIPLKRLGTPDDIVNMAVFLASDEASYITGANMVIDGGWSAVLPWPDK
jgi:NAD(P)-dependent dehydrogenase (short-subunit alcohol dehydrogenase family)